MTAALSASRVGLRSVPRLHFPVLAGAVLLAGLIVLTVFGDAFAPYRATALSGPPLAAPGSGHLLGTNALGQDVTSQLILGSRASVLVAVLAGAGTVLIGAIVGVAAGWFGGLTEAALMRFTDLVLVLPKLPLLLLVGALTGGSIGTLSILLAATFWPVTARVLRSQVLTLRGRTHVRAAAGFGAGSWHQLRRHILPDLALLMIAEFIPAAGHAVALQAGLAFLGIGDPTQPSWGTIMRDALAYPALFITSAWTWWLLPPIIAIVVLVVLITLLGTSAERHLIPRLGRHQ